MAATPMIPYLVGWRAYSIDDCHRIEFMGFGRDIIMAPNVGRAMRQALVEIPRRIHEPGCMIAIRYVKERMGYG